jgi:hypothetical protein
MMQKSIPGRLFVCFLGFLVLERCLNRNSGLQNSSGYTLSGKITGIDSGWIFVKHRQVPELDSAPIINGIFTVSGNSETEEFCNIGTGNGAVRDFYFGFFLQPGKLKLSAHKDSLNDAAVRFEGSETQNEFNRFQQRMRSIDSLVNLVHKNATTASDKDSLAKLENAIEAERKEFIRNYIRKTPNSYVSVFEGYSYLTDKEDLPTLDSLYQRLDTSLRHWYYALKIEKQLKNRGTENK